jgi:hypothetical protein
MLVGGCGDDDDSGSTTGSTESAGTMGTVGTTGTAGTTTLDTTGAATDSGSSDGSSSGGDDGMYSAVAIPGDPNTIQIRRRDDDNDRCSWIVLTDQSVGFLAIATPAGWTPQVGLTNTNPASCDGADPLMGGSVEAIEGTGEITQVEPGTAFPCVLDVDAEITFDDFTEPFTATGLPVDGC